MVTVAVDWDDTLVDVKTQAWLPGAVEALRQFRGRGYRVVVHTCRANWPEGLASVETRLLQAGLRPPAVTVQAPGAGKPHADAYVDDRAIRFTDDWAAVIHEILGRFPLAAPRRAVIRG